MDRGTTVIEVPLLETTICAASHTWRVVMPGIEPCQASAPFTKMFRFAVIVVPEPLRPYLGGLEVLRPVAS